MPEVPDLQKTKAFIIDEGSSASDFLHILLLTENSAQIQKTLGAPDSTNIFFDFFTVDNVGINVKYKTYKKDTIEYIRITTDRFKTKGAQIGYWATRQEVFAKYGCKAPQDNGVEITYPQFGVGFDFDEDPQGNQHATGVRLLPMNPDSPNKLSHKIVDLHINSANSVDNDKDGKYSSFEYDWSVVMPGDSGYVTETLDKWYADSSRWVQVAEDNNYYFVHGSKPVQLYFGNGGFSTAGQAKYRLNVITVAGFTAIDTIVTVNVEPASQDSLVGAMP
jgi:hypothetical protein